MTLRIAVLGAGRIGKVHAHAIGVNDEAWLVAVADAFSEVAESLAEKHNCDIRTIDEIEASGDVDAVIICTPTDTHADLIERFARAGKAIFCEKPVDLSAQRVRECLAVVEETGATLMVGFNRRFDASFANVHQAVVNGEVGDVELVQITSRDPSPPPLDYIARSGGMLRDMTIHDFDLARFLLGEEPIAVSAHASVLVDPEIGKADDVDTATILLETASGKQAVITNSRRATYGYDQRIEVLGSKGMVAAGNQRPNSVEIATDEGFKRAPIHHFFMDRYEQAFADENAAFVSAVNNGTVALPSGKDGLAALLLADAAYVSLAEKRRVLLSELN